MTLVWGTFRKEVVFGYEVSRRRRQVWIGGGIGVLRPGFPIPLLSEDDRVFAVWCHLQGNCQLQIVHVFWRFPEARTLISTVYAERITL